MQRLRVTTADAALVAGLALLGVTATQRLSHEVRERARAVARVSLPPSPTSAPRFLVRTTSGLDTVGAGAGGHLVVFYGTTCRYSLASVEQWQRLSRDLCGTAKVWFVSDEPLLEQTRFWKGAGGTAALGCADAMVAELLAPDQVRRDYRIPGTPTHVFLAEGGRVLGTYVGVLDRSSVRRRIRSIFSSESPG